MQTYVPNLTLFDEIYHAAKNSSVVDLANVVFVCVQHELAITINLFETLLQLGADPKKIFLLGKYYSTCTAVAKHLATLGIQQQPNLPQQQLGEFATTFKASVLAMWKNVLKYVTCNNTQAIIILDDGGRCLATTPLQLCARYPIIGIEQTTAGIANPDLLKLPFPIIEVASSAAKRNLEPPIIATSAITAPIYEILQSLPSKPYCGVIGIGHIGMAVARKLLTLGYEVIGFDINPAKLILQTGCTWANNIEQVLQKATFIFGCTGQDITHNLNFHKLITSNKIFFSCTSEDKEFTTLLKLIQQQKPQHSPNLLANVSYQTSTGYQIEIYRSGFPITFDGGPQPCPVVDIQITQGLLLGALIQAATLLATKTSLNFQTRLMLAPIIQRFVTATWATTQPIGRYPQQLLRNFTDENWIKMHSGGNHYPDGNIRHMFS